MRYLIHSRFRLIIEEDDDERIDQAALLLDASRIFEMARDASRYRRRMSLKSQRCKLIKCQGVEIRCQDVEMDTDVGSQRRVETKVSSGNARKAGRSFDWREISHAWYDADQLKLAFFC